MLAAVELADKILQQVEEQLVLAELAAEDQEPIIEYKQV
jgi:hypothetical protein